MENNLKNSSKKNTLTSGGIQFTKIKSRKKFEEMVYKKVTKKDFVMAFMFSFLFIFGVFSVQNPEFFMGVENNFKADMYSDYEEVYDNTIDSEFKLTPYFFPENKVIKNGQTCSEYQEFTDADDNTYEECIGDINMNYYVLDTPDKILDIGIDKIIKDPSCGIGKSLVYRFQGTSKYLKYGEIISESDSSYGGVNYPLLSTQKGINANYKIDSTGTGITIYFDKDIKNGKYYDFALKDGITIYENYKTLDKFKPGTFTGSISGKELYLEFSEEFKTNFGRIVIDDNLISDLDGRINNHEMVVGKKIFGDIVIDNKKPGKHKVTGTGSKIISVSFDENIYENSDVNLAGNIFSGSTALSSLDDYSEYELDGNLLRITFNTDTSDTLNLKFGTGIIIDKAGNENDGFQASN